MLKKPTFWRNLNWLSCLLYPFSLIYIIGIRLNMMWTYPKRVNVPVIVVGNVTLGGSGKTPLTIAIAKHFIAQNKEVAVISRGYGGTLNEQNLVVKVGNQDVKEVGDEALILSKTTATYINKDRYKAAVKATEDGAEVIIMDDGLQNYTLHKDFSILAIDSHYGLGNGFTIPAGPLREPINWALKKADCICITGGYSFDVQTSKPQFDVDQAIINGLTFDKQYIAMCAIANPDKFFSTIEGLGIEIVNKFIFADHHTFTDLELENILNKSKQLNIKIITTQKDIVKIAHASRIHFTVLEIEYNLPQNLIQLIHQYVKI